jgi:hypothetical protein
MIDVISSKFTSIATECIIRNAKEFNVDKSKVQLVFKLGVDGNSEYLICKEYKPQRVLTFLQVLGVRIDIKGYSLFVPKFIKGALNRFCEEEKISKHNVRVMIMTSEKGSLNMWLYNDSQYVKQVLLESLFDASDMVSMEQ